MQSSSSSSLSATKLLDKAKRKIQIVVTDSTKDVDTNYNNFIPKDTNRLKNTNIECNGDYQLYKTSSFALDENFRSKNDKNWENWERIREQKLERMKTICFENYRQSIQSKMQHLKPKPKQLDPNWYTENIYSNHSEDLDDDYITAYMHQKFDTDKSFRNMKASDEMYTIDDITGDTRDITTNDYNIKKSIFHERRGEGEGSASYNLHRSISCKEFMQAKTKEMHSSSAQNATASILKNRSNVPKSHSFNLTSTKKTTPFDVMDYEVPTPTAKDHYPDLRKAPSYYSRKEGNRYGPCLCYASGQSANAKYPLHDMYSDYYDVDERRPWRYGVPMSSSIPGVYGAIASDGSNKNLQPTIWWDDNARKYVSTTSHCPWFPADIERKRLQSLPPMVICCCAADVNYCYHRQQQHHIPRSLRTHYHCPSHHPAAEEEEHAHCPALKEDDVGYDHFIIDNDAADYFTMPHRFPNEVEGRYSSANLPQYKHDGDQLRLSHSKTAPEVLQPSRYDDDDSYSDSTEMDLHDFNMDLEKYWEELEKPPSPIDVDMQRRNMHSNLKVKNVNVGCYNNGQPKDMHDREQERLLIKKSLLEGMPSPPQIDHSVPTTNKNNNFLYESAIDSPSQSSYRYGHKIYPKTLKPDIIPFYEYNNTYNAPPAADGVQTQQPTMNRLHTSASGNSALSVINNIFSIYKPNKYALQNCHFNNDSKLEPCKKMNISSTCRPLITTNNNTYSMKRPLTLSSEQPHFKIIPEKTGLKISSFYDPNDNDNNNNLAINDADTPSTTRLKLTSTARPLVLPY